MAWCVCCDSDGVSKELCLSWGLQYVFWVGVGGICGEFVLEQKHNGVSAPKLILERNYGVGTNVLCMLID